MSELISAPPGMGVYLRNFDRPFRLKNPPSLLAKKLVDHGIKHAAILACWDDHEGLKKSNDMVAAPYAEELRKNGVKVGLWGFPHPDRISPYIDQLVSITDQCGGGVAKGGTISYWLHDPEVYWKYKGSKKANMSLRGQGEATKMVGEPGSREHLDTRAHELVVEDMVARSIAGIPGCGVTSYGMADWHPIPYKQFFSYGHIWGSPQLYSVTPAMVDRGLKSWQDRGSTVNIPSVPAFGKNSALSLEGHLNAFVDKGTPVKVDGMVIWSYRQLSNSELSTIQKFSEKQGW